MTSKRMASSIELDALSNLPDVLLIKIISCLSFKECLRTSLLSKRWRYHGYCMETFEIRFSLPLGFAAEMESLIEFAVSRKVENLVLDFTDYSWLDNDDASTYYEDYVHLPANVYNLRTLESLKIYSCGYDHSKFTNSGSLRKLSIGWIELTGDESLILTSPTLKSLSFSYCWGVDINNIAGDIKEFEFESCEFSLYMACSFDLPNVEIFKYSGQILAFDVKKMNKYKEGYLDFEAEDNYEEPNQRTKLEGTMLSGFLNSLRGARTLTVCPFLLQAIQECDDPSSLLRPMETQHLVLRTRMHVMEFKGITLLLDNCPNLETLTLDILSRSFYSYAKSYCGVGPRSYWKKNLTYEILPKTLKVVVVRNFSGCFGELNVLKILIQLGRGRCPGRAHGPVLERVELYVRSDMAECKRMEAHDGAEMLQSISGGVQVLVHDPKRVAAL
ncbi:PREDICTED: putative F-box/LRR-repeat protein At1g56400 [Camelina sativa]|uniref:F-box/LRR-repeat protein At1g56400 n=1 Tax=Camelina sativa TaxID=90675 RepID=A0ABM0UTJ5_CAMSA|nr:PREDICTED: putative F-box/LRR-repeat protein At1g56400 [Camelina sativa]